MKIAVMNFSGNVGKTTVTRHLLAPRLPSAQVIAIESINADDYKSTVDTTMRGKQFGELQERLLSGNDLMVDVGASNVEDLVGLMAEYDGSHEDFDLFVIPTVPAKKQQRDTLGTVDSLSRMGVDPERIRIVFNMVERGNNIDLQRQFAPLYDYCQSTGAFRWRPDVLLYESEAYAKAAEVRRSIADICADPEDYKARIVQTEDAAEKVRLAKLVAIKRLALGINAELDRAFSALMRSPGDPA